MPPAALKVTNKRSIKVVTADMADMHQSPTRLWRYGQDNKKYIWKNLCHSDELQDFSGIPLGAFGQGREFDLGADAVSHPPLASVYILSEFYSDGKIRDTNFSRCFFFFFFIQQSNTAASCLLRLSFEGFSAWDFPQYGGFSKVGNLRPSVGWIKAKAGGWINQINFAKNIYMFLNKGHSSEFYESLLGALQSWHDGARIHLKLPPPPTKKLHICQNNSVVNFNSLTFQATVLTQRKEEFSQHQWGLEFGLQAFS